MYEICISRGEDYCKTHPVNTVLLSHYHKADPNGSKTISCAWLTRTRYRRFTKLFTSPEEATPRVETQNQGHRGCGTKPTAYLKGVDSLPSLSPGDCMSLVKRRETKASCEVSMPRCILERTSVGCKGALTSPSAGKAKLTPTYTGSPTTGSK